jgi:choline-sulfatase
MAAQGYETYFSGKWHISTDPEKCFHHVVHERPGMPGAVREGYNRPIAGRPDPWSPSDPKFGGFWKGGKHWSEVLGDDSIAFLEQAAKSDKPFFMYLAFNAPHDPRQSPREYVDRYPLDRITLPENFLPEYPEKEAIGAGKDLRDESLAPFPRDEHAVKVHRQEYYAIVTHMDTQVGRILAALEKSGKADNTWIIFTSDHGLAVGHHGLMGKQNMYDHSLRVPFIVNGPGVKAGAKIDTPIHLQDAMATALDLAGADMDGIEFQSVRPMLAGEKGGLDAVYAAYMDKQRAVIQDGWKLILYPKARTAKLFHLAEDPQELRNLAADPAQADRKKVLFAKLQDLQQQYGDRLDLGSVFPDLK